MPEPFVPALRAASLLRRLLHGAHPALPRPLDRCAERWAGLPPRLRVAAVCVLLLALVGTTQARVRAAEERWGGPPVHVWVAATDVGIGEVPGRLERVAVPPALVPPRATTAPTDGRALSLPLPAGAVLTEAHLEVRGPAAGLAPGLRAVPVQVDEGWGIVAGAWVDVWVLAPGGPEGAVRQAAARSRPVLDVRDDGAGPTALVGLELSEVETVTGGLAEGRLLLTHAPPPGD